MRITPASTLILALMVVSPLHAQTPATQPATTQPATRPAIQRLGLSPAKALDFLEVPAAQKTQVLKIVETRDKASKEWSQQNSAQRKLYSDDYAKAKAAGDNEELKSLGKLMEAMDKEQSAFYTDARKQITDILTPEVAKDYFTLTTLPPPPIDRSRMRSVMITFEQPDFTPEITRSVRDALLEMTQEPKQLDIYFSLQQTAMEAGIKKALSLFPDGQQFSLMTPFPEPKGDIIRASNRASSLDLTRDQVAAIVKAVAEMKSQPTPEASAVEKALRQTLATLTDAQKFYLHLRTIRGTPSFSSSPPAITADKAIESLNLSHEKKAQALKFLQDNKTQTQQWREKTEATRIALRQSYLKARKNNDQATMAANEKRSTELAQEDRAMVDQFNKEFKELLGETDYQRFTKLMATPSTQPGDASN